MNRKLELYYDKPALRWEETLPVGNGSLGAMIWGGVREELLGLNEESLWSGYERDKNNPGASHSLNAVRELVFAGRCAEAEKLIQDTMLGEFNESYMPLGNLHIAYRNLKESDQVGRYRRSLDIEKAMAAVSFEADGVGYRREIFATYPGQAVIICLESDRPLMELEIFLESQLKCCIREMEDALIFSGRCPEHVDPSYVRKGEEAVIWGYRGRRFSGGIRVLSCDGTVLCQEGTLRVAGASELVLCLEAVRPSSIEGSYDRIKEEHVLDYGRIFDTVELYLGEQKDLPTDRRLEQLKEGEEDNGLFALYFQYGRYLMAASSRKGSLPANLQGIWSWKFQAPWSCNWTTNINLEMNYWPALSCGLKECMEPYFSFVEELAKRGRQTAAVNYHCRGTAHHHNADGWYSTNPVGIPFGAEDGKEGCAAYAMWPMGMAWLSQEFYRYYEYTKDRKFLENRAYPLLRDTALFLVDWLVEYEGYYVTCPSTSPENKYYDKDKNRCSITAASAMDMELTKEVFEHYLSVCAKLGVNDDLTDTVQERLARLWPVRIGSRGQILEWLEEYPEVEPGHRHLSHLYGMFPAELWEGDQKMTEACRISLNDRLENGGGYTGWSCAWIINMFAALKDGENAWKYLYILLTRSTYPNLWDAHEPFQIDGNFGGTTGIANMLATDRGGHVDILPALPRQFASGYVRGLCLKGNKTVDIRWEDGSAVSVEFHDADEPDLDSK
ncbi:glycoside hydrolase family 95 protein [Lachnotalea sp. AF33-28]|uniref:glycoside hydrolase family 95 protein n=1 Tax=Lachnotalea sp. AF33-28 TaxID=2292046 RepID=UPI000E4BB4AB|nr:glycoside hydrolase family 95 protein [Lachnotalea sp. AF33-28]RHP32348.1 glycoside hydrolase family 95 protein [Lachnotalea sp. AF33-28]